MNKDAVTRLFEAYAGVVNAALLGHPDLDAMADLYEDAFIGAAPGGVMVGSKGAQFEQAMSAGFDRNRKIGAKSMSVRHLSVEAIDDLHVMARVDWRAIYDIADGETAIDFTNVYLVRVTKGRAKVFGWITGDEEAELRKHGIV